MILKDSDFIKAEIENMYGGDGVVSIAKIQEADNMINCRLLAKVIIPVGASIGNHEHNQETEYYIILKGEGEVNDNGKKEKVSEGEVVVTVDKSKHSIKNIGSQPLEMIAAIITY